MVKIIKFRDSYFQECQWSGAKLKSRYGIPKEKARKDGDSRDGSFADAACAVAWIHDQVFRGNMEDARSVKLLELIRKDLGLDKIQPYPKNLYAAPALDPTEPDFSYRQDHPYMYKPRLHVPVEEDISTRKTKGSGSGEESSGEEKKKMFWLYTVKTDSGIEETQLPFKQILQLPQVVRGSTFYSLTNKSKDIIVLSSNDSDKVNHQVNTTLGIDCPELKGTCYLLMKKPLYKREREHPKSSSKLASSSLPESSESIIDRVLVTGTPQPLNIQKKRKVTA